MGSTRVTLPSCYIMVLLLTLIFVPVILANPQSYTQGFYNPNDYGCRCSYAKLGACPNGCCPPITISGGTEGDCQRDQTNRGWCYVDMDLLYAAALGSRCTDLQYSIRDELKGEAWSYQACENPKMKNQC